MAWRLSGAEMIGAGRRVSSNLTGAHDETIAEFHVHVTLDNDFFPRGVEAVSSNPTPY